MIQPTKNLHYAKLIFVYGLSIIFGLITARRSEYQQRLASVGAGNKRYFKKDLDEKIFSKFVCNYRISSKIYIRFYEIQSKTLLVYPLILDLVWHATVFIKGKEGALLFYLLQNTKKRPAWGIFSINP